MSREFERLVRRYRKNGVLSTAEVLEEFGLEIHDPLPPDQEYHLAKMANTIKEMATTYTGGVEKERS